MDRVRDAQEVRDALGAEPAEVAGPEASPPAPRVSWWEELLTRPTGPGTVDAYLDHPLCWGRVPWLARVIRGLTGLLGDLGLAVVDIGIGLLEGIWSRRRPAPAVSGPGGPDWQNVGGPGVPQDGSGGLGQGHPS